MWLSRGSWGQGGGIPKHAAPSRPPPLLLRTWSSTSADRAGDQGHWDLHLNLGLHVLLAGDTFSTSPAASLRTPLMLLQAAP